MAEPETKRIGRVSPEALSVGAILLAVITGGSGLGINLQSNNSVSVAVKDMRDSWVEMRGALKDLEKSLARMDGRQDKIEERFEKSRDEVNEIRQRVALLEQREKERKQ